MKTRDLIELLIDAQTAMRADYLAAGGDRAAMTNAVLRSRGKLIERIDRALKEEGPRERRLLPSALFMRKNGQ